MGMARVFVSRFCLHFLVTYFRERFWVCYVECLRLIYSDGLEVRVDHNHLNYGVGGAMLIMHFIPTYLAA
jgi:hypothetical protein